MKKILLLSFTIAFPLFLFSQTPIGYDYDAAGNRTARYILGTKSTPAEDIADVEPGEYNLEGESKILLYPNPTAGILNFEITGPQVAEELKIEVRVYSTGGAVILNETHYLASFNVDITDHPQGIYLMDLYVNGKKQLFTIIKE